MRIDGAAITSSVASLRSAPWSSSSSLATSRQWAAWSTQTVFGPECQAGLQQLCANVVGIGTSEILRFSWLARPLILPVPIKIRGLQTRRDNARCRATPGVSTPVPATEAQGPPKGSRTPDRPAQWLRSQAREVLPSQSYLRLLENRRVAGFASNEK